MDPLRYRWRDDQETTARLWPRREIARQRSRWRLLSIGASNLCPSAGKNPVLRRFGSCHGGGIVQTAGARSKFRSVLRRPEILPGPVASVTFRPAGRSPLRPRQYFPPSSAQIRCVLGSSRQRDRCRQICRLNHGRAVFPRSPFLAIASPLPVDRRNYCTFVRHALINQDIRI